MRVALLGSLEVTDDDGRPIRVAGRRLQVLLLRLAVDPGLSVPGPELVDTLWPDDVPTDPTNALQSLVSRLRRALGDAHLVAQDGTGYRLLIDGTAIDAVRFAQLVTTGRRELGTGDPAAALGTLSAAERIWRGEPFAEAGDAWFATSRRARLSELRLGAGLDRSAALVALDRSAEAVAELEALAEANPLNEPVAAGLLRALAAAGRVPEALARYESVRRFLDDQLGTEPGPELQALHLRLLRGELASAVEPAAPRPVRRGRLLRSALTSFVGRAEDVGRASAAVEAHRLTTLIGAGGAGKTRLAIEVANRWLASHDDPAWLVELAPVSDPEHLAGTILNAIGGRDTRITERSDRLPGDARERLLDRLRDSRCLLVVDNCEHVLDPVARLIDEILATAPDVRVLATSRELLGLTGEALCAIAPLPLPAADVSLDAALDQPAVRLWLDRAAAARPDFRLDPDTLPSVVEIVRRLDGLPLAIELAAARLRVLPISEISDRLSDRFRLLTGGNRTSLPRHRTLRAVVEWSWDLLTPAERLLAERLAVFPGGADLADATQVCADTRLPADAVEALLGSLVDKSLLQTDVPATPTPPPVRYRMLETIREYGLERLAERDELATARLAHAEHYAAIVIECEPVLRARDQLSALARLDRDRDNVLAALRYLTDSGRGEQALTLLLALAWYWAVLDRTTEMTTWAALVLEVNEGSDLPQLAFARAALVLADLTEGPEAGSRSWETVRAQLDETGEQLAAAPDPPFPGLEVLRCMVAAFAGRPDTADRLLARASESTDRWLRAAVHAAAANLFENSGELSRMRAALDVAYPEFVEIGDRWGLSTTLIAQAQLATLDGKLDDAVAAYREARRCVRELGSSDDDSYLNIRLVDLQIRRGDFDAAKAELEELQSRGPGSAESERTMFASASMVLVEWHTGHPERSLELAAEIRAELAARVISTPMLGHLRGVILAATGVVAALAGDIDQATADLRIAYPAALETRDQPIVAATGTAVAGWLAARGRFADAATALGAAAAVRGADDWTDRTVATIAERLRTELGAEFDPAYDAGRRLSRTEAHALLEPERYL